VIEAPAVEIGERRSCVYRVAPCTEIAGLDTIKNLFPYRRFLGFEILVNLLGTGHKQNNEDQSNRPAKRHFFNVH
jgi:hypothetical protein